MGYMPIPPSHRSFLLFMLFLAALSSTLTFAACKKSSDRTSKRSQNCIDFSRQVTAVCRTHLLPAATAASDKESLRKEIERFTTSLRKRCESGKLPQRDVMCVLKLGAKTFAAVRKCLPGEDFPEVPGGSEEAEEGED